MTYFKTRGRRPIVIDLIDPRRIEAAIDLPVWWRSQAEAVNDASPWVDFSSECVGTSSNPRDFGWVTVEVRDADASEIVEEHGITGLAVGRELELRLAKPAEVVDIGIAHFGEPATVIAHAGKKQVAKAVTDARPRQIENVRLIGAGLDRFGRRFANWRCGP